MANRPYVRSKLTLAALGLVPPLIRKRLLQERRFREEYGLRADPILSFDDSGVSVHRSPLFDAIRKILSGVREKKITDMKGKRWRLKTVNREGELPNLALSRGNRRLILPDFSPFSPDRATRLRSLAKAASEFNLPNSARETWQDVIAERTLLDDELDAFHGEFRDTPVLKMRTIRSEFANGQGKLSTLVPLSRRYFERLVGAYDGSDSIQAYAAGRGKMLFSELSTWHPYEGFLLGLFLSSHSSLTAEINVEQMSSDDLMRALNFLNKHGDRISQLGAIEIGLRILPSRREIEKVLISLVEKIRDDDVTRKGSGFQLLSALFILVDGELSKTRLLSREPPFYRRLAALSQATLIHRQIMKSGVDVDSFCKWALSHGGQQFYLQSLADMRAEPRWNPDYVAASQMKADFFGRLMIAAKNHEQNVKGGELSNLLLETKPGGLLVLSEFPYPYLPGPLEGSENIQSILPAEISRLIDAQLSGEQPEASSFIALVNSALTFQIGADQAELAARALKLGSHRLINLQDRSQLIAILNGLSSVAAITRSHVLSDELRILTRRYRRDPAYRLSIEEVVRICLVTAASRANLPEWRDFAGDWLTELAFSDLEGDEGYMLYVLLERLCQVVPELWVSCGRADAALIAYNGAEQLGSTGSRLVANN